MNNINSNITLRDYNQKSMKLESKKTNEPRETIKTATFVDTWKIENFKKLFSFMLIKTPIASPEFAHNFNGSIINCKSRIYQVDVYGGLLVIESQLEGVETSTAKVQCFLRKANGTEIRLSTSKRDNNRFKHVTQPSIVLNEANDLIENDVLTVVLKIQITINQDYYSIRNFRLADDLGNLLESGSFSDVTLIVDGSEIKAHKGILACRSSAFASLFHNESGDTVQIDNYDFNVVNELLNFCYTGWVEQVSVELLRASEEFDIVGLKIICEDYFCRNLNVDNAVALLVCAEHYRAPTLEKKATKFIAENLKKIVKTTKLKSLSHSTILEIMQMWSTL